MNLQDLEILEDDFDLFVALNDTEKIEFLFDAIEQGIQASVNKQVSKLTSTIPSHKEIARVEDYQIGGTRLALTILKNEIHLNSDKLRAIRKFVNKMINDGLLLWPIKRKKSVFDMYRYFKAYKLIGRVGPVSSN